MKQLDQIQNNISEIPNGIESKEKDKECSPLPRVVPKNTSYEKGIKNKFMSFDSRNNSDHSTPRMPEFGSSKGAGT